MTDKEPEDEPKYVVGELHTVFRCVCGDVYDFNGDMDGEEIECPGCNAKVIVRREDK